MSAVPFLFLTKLKKGGCFLKNNCLKLRNGKLFLISKNDFPSLSLLQKW